MILALWAIFMLALLAVAVGAYVDSRLTLARRIEQRTLGYYAARSGIEQCLVRLKQDTNGWDSLTEDWAEYRNAASNIVCVVGDEQSRIDLNLARVELLTTLLQDIGGLGGEASARLAEALNTARSKPVDNAPGLGEQTGWQDSRFERGPFRSVEEVRWVKGMTDEVFDKIRGQVTVHGGYRVNLNTADASVLRVLAQRAGSKGGGGVESLVKKILQFRERGGIFKTYLGSGVVEALGPEARLTEDERSRLYGMAPYVTVVSDHFRGWAEGAPLNRAGEFRRLDFVWDRKRHQFEFWHED